LTRRIQTLHVDTGFIVAERLPHYPYPLQPLLDRLGSRASPRHSFSVKARALLSRSAHERRARLYCQRGTLARPRFHKRMIVDLLAFINPPCAPAEAQRNGRVDARLASRVNRFSRAFASA